MQSKVLTDIRFKLEAKKTNAQAKVDEEKLEVELYPKSEADIYMNDVHSASVSDRSLPIDVIQHLNENKRPQ